MKPNHLIREKSPYLLQHAHNPVLWHPWSDAVFEQAEKADKPVFLSIGYATCHWCHVMEKESFEDEEAAEHLNDAFICIKVDREERPDIDAVYMAVCQMLSGRGGWPLTVCLTPDKKPFFAATYLPKQGRSGQLGVVELCRQVTSLWQSDRKRVLNTAENALASLNQFFLFSKAAPLNTAVLDRAYADIAESFDSEYGGFLPAPKFPVPHRLLFLLRYHERTGKADALSMVTKTLKAIGLGGIRDHAGSGFHRYATDSRWLLPHFEKMLYDQALLAIAYLKAFQMTGDDFFADRAKEIFTYVLRDMTSDEGGFYAAEDADSEGEEGKFYVWTLSEFQEVLGKEEALFWKDIFHLTPDGNYEDEATGKKTGANILHLTADFDSWAERLKTDAAKLKGRWESARQHLFNSREKRIHPLKDDKILTDWNGLMIAAFALGARVMNRSEYQDAAVRSLRFIRKKLMTPKGELLHRYRDGESGIPAFASDYAFLIRGVLELMQTVSDPEFMEFAIRLQKRMITDFWDTENNGFFLTGKDEKALPVRPKELYDGALPSANSVSLENLVRLAQLTGDTEWETFADQLIQGFSGTVRGNPSAYTYFLTGAAARLNAAS